MTGRAKSRLILGILVLLGVAVVGYIAQSPAPLSSMVRSFRPVFLPPVDESISIEIPTLLRLSSEEAPSLPSARAVFHRGRNDRLVVVISGMLGRAVDGLSYVFSEPFRRRGYSVLILPSPSLVDFAYHRISQQERTNYASSVQALCKVVAELIGPDERGKIQELILAGYSLGGRHVLSMTACARPLFPKARTRVFALNPPIDFSFALDRLDTLLREAAADPLETALAGSAILSVSKLSSWAVDITAKPTDIRSGLDRWLALFSGSDDRLRRLVAASFAVRLEPIRDSRPETPFGLVPIDKQFSFKSYLANSPMSAADYFNEITTSDPYRTGDLFIVHSRDDFLIRSEDADRIGALMGERAIILPDGGHVGSIFEPIFEEIVESEYGGEH